MALLVAAAHLPSYKECRRHATLTWLLLCSLHLQPHTPTHAIARQAACTKYIKIIHRASHIAAGLLPCSGSAGVIIESTPTQAQAYSEVRASILTGDLPGEGPSLHQSGHQQLHGKAAMHLPRHGGTTAPKHRAEKSKTPSAARIFDAPGESAPLPEHCAGQQSHPVGVHELRTQAVG
jgi:hypothetical protein